MLDRLLSKYSTTIDFREFLFHLGLTALLCLWVSMLFVWVARDRHRVMRLARLLPAIGMVMALMSTVIASSLAIAIGLVGTFSTFRYRTQIPDVEDLIFIFLTIAVGFAGGTGQLVSAGIGLLVLSCVLIGRHFFELRHHAEVTVEIRGPAMEVEAVLPALQARFPDMELRSLDEQRGTSEWHFSFHPTQFEDVIALREVLATAENLKFTLRDAGPST